MKIKNLVCLVLREQHSFLWNRESWAFHFHVWNSCLVTNIHEYSWFLINSKVGCVLPMVNWSELRLRQYRDDDHREDVPHFRSELRIRLKNLVLIVFFSGSPKNSWNCDNSDSYHFSPETENGWLKTHYLVATKNHWFNFDLKLDWENIYHWNKFGPLKLKNHCNKFWLLKLKTHYSVATEKPLKSIWATKTRRFQNSLFSGHCNE